MLNKKKISFIQVEKLQCQHFSQVHLIILTAPEKGSTLSLFQKHQPAGGCYDVSPFEKQEQGEREQ